MITVGCYTEMNVFADDGSIKDFLVDKVDYNKEKVIEYLSSQKKIASCPKEVVDCINGKVIQSGFSVHEDGEFTWCDFLIYYVKNYNIKLPQKFIDKINDN